MNKRQENYDITQRVTELHKKLGKVTQNKTTTAVGFADEEIGIIGSSEGKLRKSVRKELYKFEIEAKGEPGKHAEEYVIDEAENRGFHLNQIAASRNICMECQQLIEENEIEAKTPFSGKKSKKRQQNG